MARAIHPQPAGGAGGVVVEIDKMAAGGDGLGHLPDGRVVFVAGAITGETVRVELLSNKRDYAKGTVSEVLEESTDRVVPPCPYVAAGCGGCSWQHIAPASQLALKVEVVRDALRRTAGLPDADVRAGAAVDPWAYRTTVRLAVRGDGRVGFRGARSHDVVVVDDCLVAHPRLGELLAGLRAWNASEVMLRVGVASGERSALAVAAPTSRRSKSRPTLAGLPDDVRYGDRAVVHERVDGTLLQVSAGSFFQSGPQAAELLVAAVRNACGPLLGNGATHNGAMLDAYGGVGMFAAALGADRPIVVESSPSACSDAAVNLAGRDSVIECLPMEEWLPVPVPLVVADPARAGLGTRGAERIAATGAEMIVLVSCDPVSLARDARLLAGLGYAHAGSEVLDLFPNTPHVEVVSRFMPAGVAGEAGA